MPIRQTAVFLTIALLLLVVIVELVRRRRLHVEYSWLWIAAGLTNLLLILRYELLVSLTEAVGAVIPTSTLFFTSAQGIPVSTTHTITGAIVGVGAARRLSAVRWRVAGRVVWAWVLTIPGAALMAAVTSLIVGALA